MPDPTYQDVANTTPSAYTKGQLKGKIPLPPQPAILQSGVNGTLLSASDGDLTWGGYADNGLYWTKIGNLCFVHFTASGMPTFTTGAGDLQIHLPFTPITAGYSMYPNAAELGLYSSGGVDTGLDQLYVEINDQDPYMYVKDKDANGVGGDVKTVAELFTSTTAVYIQAMFFYFIDPEATLLL